jgi:glutamine cyclotransferase
MLTFDEARFKKVNEAYSLEGQGVQIIKEQTSLKVGDGVTEVTENNRSDPLSTEKQRETDDGNRYEMQEDIKYSEETEEETEESEEAEEEDNV